MSRILETDTRVRANMDSLIRKRALNASEDARHRAAWMEMLVCSLVEAWPWRCRLETEPRLCSGSEATGRNTTSDECWVWNEQTRYPKRRIRGLE